MKLTLPEEEFAPPQRILIVSPSAHAIDLLLDKLTPVSKKVNILRIGTSHTRPDLNKKFALEIPKTKDNPEAAIKVQERIKSAQIVITGADSLKQHSLEKSPHIFDTVIIDDASLINEADCLAALRHGAVRMILFGNSAIDQSMFLLKK